MAKTVATALPDVHVVNHGSIFTFEPRTRVAREWIADHVSDPVWFSGTIAVEHRFARDLADGMLDAGLVVR